MQQDLNKNLSQIMNSDIKRFYSFDVLRGIAALSVIFWHWQHFFLPLNKQGVIFIVDRQPFFDTLFVLYTYGHTAVQLFFSLSGFIFFWMYSGRIFSKTVNLKSFFFLRFSRLYPLHFATLILICAGQFLYKNITKNYFVYPFNDIYHFGLNFFLISSWGIQKGFSFNAPIWSVSVELLLYLIFFLFCKLFHRNTSVLIFIILIAHFSKALPTYIESGISGFFLGGIIFNLYNRITKSSYFYAISIFSSGTAFFSWVLTIWGVYNNFSLESFHWTIKGIFHNWAVFILFPITILALSLIETSKGAIGKKLSFLGDISYSVYLIHFPLQLAMAMVIIKLEINENIFYSSWFMGAFFGFLILLSLISYHYFEMPMQNTLREKYLSS